MVALSIGGDAPEEVLARESGGVWTALEAVLRGNEPGMRRRRALPWAAEADEDVAGGGGRPFAALKRIVPQNVSNVSHMRSMNKGDPWGDPRGIQGGSYVKTGDPRISTYKSPMKTGGSNESTVALYNIKSANNLNMSFPDRFGTCDKS